MRLQIRVYISTFRTNCITIAIRETVLCVLHLAVHDSWHKYVGLRIGLRLIERRVVITCLLALLLATALSADARRALPEFPELKELREDILPFYVYEHEDCKSDDA